LKKVHLNNVTSFYLFIIVRSEKQTELDIYSGHFCKTCRIILS